MSREPVVGGDVGSWGTVLNDFLSVSHKTDGTLKTGGPESIYVPQIVGGWYVNPLCRGGRTGGNALNTAYLHAFFSGPGITIDAFDINVTTIGGAGAVTRIGLYQLSNQAAPWSWSVASVWATLLVDAGTIATDGTTGIKTLTLGTPKVIPAQTWFAVAGVDQVALAVRSLANGAVGFSPFGAQGQPSYLLSGSVSLVSTGVTGALPPSFTPTGAHFIDGGVGIHRSA